VANSARSRHTSSAVVAIDYLSSLSLLFFILIDYPLLTEAGVRGQEAVFVTGIYTPLQKLFALKGEVLDKGCSD
jgi:hypothetical protein